MTSFLTCCFVLTRVALCFHLDRYHLGTVAFGSLLIALVQLIRVILEYVDHKLRESQTTVAKFVMKYVSLFGSVFRVTAT